MDLGLTVVGTTLLLVVGILLSTILIGLVRLLVEQSKKKKGD